MPETTVWESVPHMLAKHRILRQVSRRLVSDLAPRVARRLSRWFRRTRSVHRGEPGSPIIALDTARTHAARLSEELVFLFIEQRRDRADYLTKEIETLKCPANFKTGLCNSVTS